ncbi:hypothetical protein CBQ28_00465 [Pseudoalteromonas sp. GCY]|uniref:DUF6176 family protein n=1 Tax=Pseudoalteromonas TaxID=53246 RepID=UPI000BFF19B1|nr:MULTISPECIES: DUF6176 family protein [Pseudoalteromonas]MCG7539224.1 DUF6176 family protein [Pseudoalteromonas sp. OF7H-1]MCG9770554.1 DUF6176 family protein [Pseudoalteromonas piscicida]PHI39023.1 hypothetical protein CBQ28_00465 [Pseudoalteromonas sp. GCY]QQQ65248.1 hypothetical protein JJQ94_01250 [Pseudoalteromonas sp. GCY]RZF99668.1 hypothetical protein EXT48_19175 [Pseudoalteromonas sp. CO348]
METKLLKIKLNLNTRPQVDELLAYMQDNIAFPREEMRQKGYFWDSVFFAEEGGREYLYIVIKSEDFSCIMMDESELICTPFREVYERFRKACWSTEPYQDIEALACFNSQMEFDSVEPGK